MSWYKIIDEKNLNQGIKRLTAIPDLGKPQPKSELQKVKQLMSSTFCNGYRIKLEKHIQKKGEVYIFDVFL